MTVDRNADQPEVVVAVAGDSPRARVAWARSFAQPGVRVLVLAETPDDARSIMERYDGPVVGRRNLPVEQIGALVVVPNRPTLVALTGDAAGAGCHVVLPDPGFLALSTAERLGTIATRGGATVRLAWQQALALGALGRHLRGVGAHPGIGEVEGVELDWRWRGQVPSLLRGLAPRALAMLQALVPVDPDVTVWAGGVGEQRLIVLVAPDMPRVVIRLTADPRRTSPARLEVAVTGARGKVTASVPIAGEERTRRPHVELTHTGETPRTVLLDAPPSLERVRRNVGDALLAAARGQATNAGLLDRSSLVPLTLRDAVVAAFESKQGVRPASV